MIIPSTSQASANQLAACTGGTMAPNGSNETDVFAGQQMLLCVAAPTGFSIVSGNWSFDNIADISGGFTNSAGTGAPSNTAGGVEATDPNLTQNGIQFYFVNPGSTETATYQWTLSNGDPNGNSSTADFSIQGPTGSLLPTATMLTDGQGVQIVSGPKLSTTGVAYPPGQVGITFTTSAQVQTGAHPSFTWIQLLNNDGTTVINSLGQVALPETPNAGLDGTYPYFSGTPTGTYDTPSSSLPDGYGELYRIFDATMYLLWDPALPAGCHTASTSTDGNYTQTPSNCTSIPIPLGSVRWRWNGCVINTLQQQTYGTWIRSCGYQQLYDSQSSGYPEWTGTVHPLGN